MHTDHISTPTLASGLTYLETASPRSPALYQLTVTAMDDIDGQVYWIDSRSTVSTYAWLEGPAQAQQIERLQIARAFTAYQHHSLIQTVGDRATRDDLIVVPCLDALYADDDVPDPQATPLLSDTIAVLRTLADGDGTVAVTANTPAFIDAVTETADHTIVARETDLGIAFEGEEFETTVYRGPCFWQTTIPYWVELLGTADTAMVTIPQEPEALQMALG